MNQGFKSVFTYSSFQIFAITRQSLSAKHFVHDLLQEFQYMTTNNLGFCPTKVPQVFKEALHWPWSKTLPLDYVQDKLIRRGYTKKAFVAVVMRTHIYPYCVCVLDG